METRPYLAIFPGLAISFAVLAFNLFGDGLRDILYPRPGSVNGHSTAHHQDTREPHPPPPSPPLVGGRGKTGEGGKCLRLVP